MLRSSLVSILLAGMSVTSQAAEPAFTVPGHVNLPAKILTGNTFQTDAKAPYHPAPLMASLIDSEGLHALGLTGPCAATLSGYGSVATERVTLRIESVTCADGVPRPLRGWTLDENHVFGLKGELIWSDTAKTLTGVSAQKSRSTTKALVHSAASAADRLTYGAASAVLPSSDDDKPVQAEAGDAVYLPEVALQAGKEFSLLVPKSEKERMQVIGALR